MRLAKHMAIIALSFAVFGVLTAMASANRLSISTQTFSVTWTSAEFSGGFGTSRCNMTIAGSIHTNTIVKTTGALVGYINRASIGRCATGSGTVLTATLPWHVAYAGFNGTLPGNIINNTYNILNDNWQTSEPVFGIVCLATSSTSSPVTGTFNLTSGRVTSVTLGGAIPCAGVRGTLGGTSSTNSAMTITLI